MQVVYLCKIFICIRKFEKGLWQRVWRGSHCTSMAPAVFSNNSGAPSPDPLSPKGVLLAFSNPYVTASWWLHRVATEVQKSNSVQIPAVISCLGTDMLIKLPGDWHPRPSVLISSEGTILAVTKCVTAIFVCC